MLRPVDAHKSGAQKFAQLARGAWMLTGLQGRSSCQYNRQERRMGPVFSPAATVFTNSLQEHYMSAPSRRPEIRRRRTRKEKITQLRKRLAAAKTDADRARLTAKLHKLEIASPGQPLLK